VGRSWRASSYPASANMRKTDRREEKELAVFNQFRWALGDPELSLGKARAGRVDCQVLGDQDQLNEPDVVCSLPSGSVRYFENVQLVPQELMDLRYRSFLDYHDLLDDSDIPLFETRYQGCLLSYDEPSHGSLSRAVSRVLLYLVQGEPAADFGTIDGQISVPYEAVSNSGRIAERLLGRSWHLEQGEI
jgi:hypothetical protein